MSSAATTQIDDFEIAKKNFFERFPQVGLYDGEIHQKNMDFFELLASPEIFKKCSELDEPLLEIIKDKELLKQMRTLNVADFNNYYEDHFIKDKRWFRLAPTMLSSMAMCLVMNVHH
jgi:hypothetical protein